MLTAKSPAHIQSHLTHVDERLRLLLLSRLLFPGYIDLNENHTKTDKELAAATKIGIASGQNKFFDASFSSMFRAINVCSKFDALFISTSQTKAYQVLPSVSINKDDIFRLSIAYYNLLNAGLSNISVYFLTLNKDYVRVGKLDVEQLFVLHDVTSRAKKTQPYLHRYVGKTKLN